MNSLPRVCWVSILQGGTQLNSNPCRKAFWVLAGVWALALFVSGAAGATVQTTPTFGAYQVASISDPAIESALRVDSYTSIARAGNTNAMAARQGGNGEAYPLALLAADASQLSVSLIHSTLQARGGSPRKDVIALRAPETKDEASSLAGVRHGSWWYHD